MSYSDLGRSVLDTLDRLPVGVQVLLFGMVVASFGFSVGLLLEALVWLLGVRLPGT